MFIVAAALIGTQFDLKLLVEEAKTDTSKFRFPSSSLQQSMSQLSPAPDAVTETILRSFIDALNAGDVAKAQSFGAEGATWWILGRPEKYPHLPIVGTHPFHQILESLPEFRRILDADPFTVTVKDIIVSREGGKAALELVPYGTSSTGKVYTHSVFMKATLDGHGKITEIREYLDFSHVEDLYGTS